MKQPKLVTRPYAPYKPIPPAKTIQQNTNIDSLVVDKYIPYTIESFIAFITSHAKNIDPKNIRLEFEIESEHMYDDYTHTIKMNLLTQCQIDNPKYDEQYVQYLKLFDVYNKANKKYKADLKKYIKDLATYTLEHDKWLLEQSKKRVKQLEAKVAKTTK